MAEFIDGLMAKHPNDNAPEWVKARISIKREEMLAFLQSQRGEWINADLKESKGGKLYFQIDDWQPDRNNAPQPDRGNNPPPENYEEPPPF